MDFMGDNNLWHVPCRKISRHVKEPCKREEEILYRHNSRQFLAKFLTASLLGVSSGICQTALDVESGMIGTRMRTRNRLQMLAVHGTPFPIPSHVCDSTVL
jgi:hypothetical protein